MISFLCYTEEYSCILVASSVCETKVKLWQVGWELAIFLGICVRILMKSKHHQSWSLICFFVFCFFEVEHWSKPI